MHIEFYWTAFALVTILASARITRLVTFDKFPPIRWLRDKYEDHTDGSDWQLLTVCGYCFAVWSSAGVVGLAWIAGVLAPAGLSGAGVSWLTPAWWLLMGVLAAAYPAAIVMKRDGDS